MSKNHPIDKIRFGRVCVTIWENASSEGKTYHSFTLQRTYTDAEGKPQNTSSFGKGDLLTLAEALRSAYKKSFSTKEMPSARKPKEAKPKAR